MKLKFSKMQATGNDFVVIDNRSRLFDLDQIISITPFLCNRRLGVGADGILVLDASETHDFSMIYRNADGSDAGMCGNGGRAISLYASSLGLGDDLHFQVHHASYSSHISGSVVILHFDNLECRVQEVQTSEQLIYKVYTGTDHIVVRSDLELLNDLEKVRAQGQSLRYDPLFLPSGTNVNFSCPSSNSIHLRTYERGVEDITLACGTGSIASAIVEHYVKESEGPSIDVHQKVKSLGGELKVSFNFDAQSRIYSKISIEGEAQIVFEGQIELHV